MTVEEKIRYCCNIYHCHWGWWLIKELDWARGIMGPGVFDVAV